MFVFDIMVSNFSLFILLNMITAEVSLTTPCNLVATEAPKCYTVIPSPIFPNILFEPLTEVGQANGVQINHRQWFGLSNYNGCTVDWRARDDFSDTLQMVQLDSNLFIVRLAENVQHGPAYGTVQWLEGQKYHFQSAYKCPPRSSRNFTMILDFDSPETTGFSFLYINCTRTLRYSELSMQIEGKNFPNEDIKKVLFVNNEIIENSGPTKIKRSFKYSVDLVRKATLTIDESVLWSATTSSLTKHEHMTEVLAELRRGRFLNFFQEKSETVSYKYGYTNSTGEVVDKSSSERKLNETTFVKTEHYLVEWSVDIAPYTETVCSMKRGDSYEGIKKQLKAEGFLGKVTKKEHCAQMAFNVAAVATISLEQTMVLKTRLIPGCPLINDIPGVSKKYSADVRGDKKHSKGVVVTISCKNTTESLVGASQYVCNGNGEWPDFEVPRCEPFNLATCNKLHDFDGVKQYVITKMRSDETYFAGTVVTFYCVDGSLELQGSREATCGDNHHWILLDLSPHCVNQTGRFLIISIVLAVFAGGCIGLVVVLKIWYSRRQETLSQIGCDQEIVGLPLMEPEDPLTKASCPPFGP